ACQMLGAPLVAGAAPERVGQPPEPLVERFVLRAAGTPVLLAQGCGKERREIGPFAVQPPVAGGRMHGRSPGRSVRRRGRERRVELNFACARRSGVEHVAAQRLAPPLRTGTRFGGGPRAVVIVLLEREVHALPGDPV